MINVTKTVDITPTPRVLRVLGELPFQPWQCFAELIDNSVDAFNKCEKYEEKRIDIVWSSERVAAEARTIEIKDSGCGMTLEQITSAVKAGYSSNDPVDNLGLFGLGFNIATAKLGEKTIVYSAREEDEQWTGIEIDFAQLVKDRSFDAPVVYLPKDDPSEHGTKIVISRLNNGIYNSIKTKESAIRKQLENVYAQLLTKQVMDIYIQNKRLLPKKHCVWSKSRYVIRDNVKVFAIQEIDRVIGTSYFDTEKNRYLTPEQEDDLIGAGNIPSHIVQRQKRIKGWVGIQRFFDTNEFGIDFIRNGRKILISNKEVFSYENEYTGTSVLQYPVELGTTVGGRIVGEIEVDYLVPTYQKNDFDRTDSSWKQTLEVLRGVGPILPKLRKSMGYTDDNTSPIGLLANAYRRTEKGTKNLALARNIAAEFYEYFLKGVPEYIEDDKWWQVVVESDRENATGDADQAGDVDAGDKPSDNPLDYLGGDTTSTSSGKPIAVEPEKPAVTSSMDALLQKSVEVASLSRRYTYDNQPAFNVKVHRMNKGEKILEKGVSVPCAFYSDGIDCDFFYDESHEIISQYQNSPDGLLLFFLAKKFSVRDGINEMVVYSRLMVENFPDRRIDKASLKDQASAIFSELREKLISCLEKDYAEVVECIKESIGENEETVSSLLSDTDLYQAFELVTSESIAVIEYVPVKTIVRLVDRFPHKLFDDKLFRAPYSKITFPDAKAEERLRETSKERVVSLLKDAQVLVNDQNSRKISKDELVRYGLSLNILKGVIV